MNLLSVFLELEILGVCTLNMDRNYSVAHERGCTNFHDPSPQQIESLLIHILVSMAF